MNRLGRLLCHPEGDAAWNMAMDQAIAESLGEAVERGESPPVVLRLYSWKKPTVSLGYFQRAAESEPRFSASSRVRRSTGGGAIVHDRELTYSLVIPSSLGERGARPDLYAKIHAVIIKALLDFGVQARSYRDELQDSAVNEKDFLCFRRRTEEDLIVHGYKVVGSAQRRHRGALLQHGSVLLCASLIAPELPGLVDLTNANISFESLADALRHHTGDAFGHPFEEAETTGVEKRRAAVIKQSRFGSQDWFRRR